MFTIYIAGVVLTFIFLLLDILFSNHFNGWDNRTQNAKIFDILLLIVICFGSVFTLIVILILWIKEKKEEKNKKKL